MTKPNISNNVEPELITGWLRTRSVARGLPAPVPDHGGWRVDTAQETEHCRYVFAGPVDGIRELALSIATPFTFIKMCGTAGQLLALVLPHWQLQRVGYLMTHAARSDMMPVLPAGYRLEIAIDHPFPATVARIFSDDGALAASGYAMEDGGFFIYDRIAVEAAHQRRGLGRAIMAALGTTQQSNATQRVLVATEAGCALYATLGWIVRSPYSTVEVIAQSE
ncbi:GNAT family N-acetyltransferase [Undibacterium sp. Ji49W]|uniref:GNAT family N-acetyltransferase n=1 Tax=Undibacterium sp. Ji49W TaxID=3413040 RepID=UPI003BF32464